MQMRLKDAIFNAQFQGGLGNEWRDAFGRLGRPAPALFTHKASYRQHCIGSVADQPFTGHNL